MKQPSNNRPMLSFAFLAFISLGIDASLMGVAWPSVRVTFNLALDAVGLLFMAGIAGFFIASFNAGRIASRLGLGQTLLTAHALRVAGLTAFVLSPFWWGLIIGAFLTSSGSALIDAGQNMYMSTNHKASHMNWMHANFGVGATLGPLMMTALITTGGSWRWGYLIVGVLEVVLCVIVVLTLNNWTANYDDETGSDRASNAQTLRLPLVWLGIGLFFMYTGLEASAGQWSFTLFTESRSVAERVAGRWVSIYWGMITVGRILIGFIADHIDIRTLLRALMVGSVISAASIWWHPAPIISFVGLALLGLSLSAIFPAMVSMTPETVGARHAANSIGFQVGAAGVGGGAISALAGVFAASIALETIGPFLLICAVIMAVFYETYLGVGRMSLLSVVRAPTNSSK